MAKEKRKKKITKASKHRLMTIGLVSICVFVYFCYTVISYTQKIINLSNEEKALQVKLDDLKTDREYLLVEIAKLQNPDYIANYARETYSYSKNGEYVIKINKEKEESSKEENKDEPKEKNKTQELSDKYKYAIIIGSGLLAVVITSIIIKNKM